MKKYFILILCLVSTFFISCDKWLEVEPPTEFDRKELFKTENGYSEALKGAYTLMSQPTLWGRNLTFGVMDALSGYYANAGDTYKNLMTYCYKKDNPNRSLVIRLVDPLWTDLYNIIANINAMLESIDNNEKLFSEDNYSVIKGEAIGLRAFLHFELLRMYGEVYSTGKDKKAIPFVSELTTNVTPILTVDQAITIIITQLEEAITLLEKDPMYLGTTPSVFLATPPSGKVQEANNIHPWHNRRFHFNYYAAKATLARAYLWKEDKAKALKYALEVIAEQETKFPWVRPLNYSQIGSDMIPYQDRTFTTEHIFALNINAMDEYTENFLNSVDYTSTANEVRYADVGVLFERNVSDIRYQYLFKSNKLVKYVQPTFVYDYFKFRVPIIRISEMFYIAAECDDNVEYLEEVRRNRGLAQFALNPNLSGDNLEAEIAKERRKEFVGEGQMWYYYKRHQYSAIPNTIPVYFNSLDLYTFDVPDYEELYGESRD